MSVCLRVCSCVRLVHDSALSPSQVALHATASPPRLVIKQGQMTTSKQVHSEIFVKFYYLD